jgi:hypothetical protein
VGLRQALRALKNVMLQQCTHPVRARMTTGLHAAELGVGRRETALVGCAAASLWVVVWVSILEVCLSRAAHCR